MGLRLDPGLAIELVAAEPQIESPVAMAFDERGRLWVVEMRDYPHGPPPGQPPESRIKVLEDRDHDGRFETSQLFAEGLSFANGLIPWRGGVLVTAAPYIIGLWDDNGDSRADRREVLFEGFAALNPQLRVSHPCLGLDGWVYVANGLRGGKIQRPGSDGNASAIDIGGRDFRFDPIGGRGEAISGMGQFGLTFDDWGHRFVCDNRHPLRQVVFPQSALRRNPDVAAASVTHDLVGSGNGKGNGSAGSDNGLKVYPISKNWTTSSLHIGEFTAACSVFIYRGSLLPTAYKGTAFTCDPTGNLIHQEILEPDPVASTFRSHRAPNRPGVEFLASPDDRFRPVALAHGPDGALYVVDMARAVIEHPDFMPPELKTRPDLLVGKDKGRIWRIVPAGAPAQAGNRPEIERLDLLHASSPDLVALLDHADAWWRTTAQRLLLERNEPSANEALTKLVRQPKTPLGRLHAAWLLDARNALDDADLAALLKAEPPAVRENAVILAGRRLVHSPRLQETVLSLADDPDPRVRFETALALGAWDDPRTLDSLATIALAGSEDSWTRLAVAAAVPGRAGLLLARLLESDPASGSGPRLTRAETPGRLALLSELAALVGVHNASAEVAGTLQGLLALDAPGQLRWRLHGLTGLAKGLSRHTHRPLESWIGKLARLNTALDQAATLSADPARPTVDRVLALRLLSEAPWTQAEPLLDRLLTGDPEPEVRVAAVANAASRPDQVVGPWLLDRFKTSTPAVRRAILAALVRQPEWTGALLDAIAARSIGPGDIDPLIRAQLLKTGSADLRRRAGEVFAGGLSEQRRRVVERYRLALDQPGDRERGKLVFQKNCAICHQVAGVGTQVGPDIADTRVKTREQLLQDILDPNSAIDGNYISYVVSTKSGQVLAGLISAETATSLTLKRAEGQSDVILRSEIAEIQSTGLSLMPEGLETTIDPAAMNDLVRFLKDWRYDDTPPTPGQPSPS